MTRSQRYIVHTLSLLMVGSQEAHVGRKRRQTMDTAGGSHAAAVSWDAAGDSRAAAVSWDTAGGSYALLYRGDSVEGFSMPTVTQKCTLIGFRPEGIRVGNHKVTGAPGVWRDQPGQSQPVTAPI
ncbi:hypothetical protein NDU88_006313 [Pleurodeles waltl]|uniref:Uncharacterized protein n=1 Tax=Pleurodeles waltl TaxID=8319 RepID=A0AAV7TD82_PLEWA|nr:hypothetical protein NDU88_006313 [Pleurodeles waltl]